LNPQPLVLYIDDAASNLFLVELIAQDLGIVLETAATGLEGIDKIKGKEYTLILSDIRLPDFSGYEILKQARNGSLNEYTPIIAFTADVTMATREKIAAHGFTDYLTKPFHNDDLVKRFSVYLSPAEAAPDLSYYSAYIKEEGQLVKAKKMILEDFHDFEKKFCHAWVYRNEQELQDQLHKIESVCQNLKLVVMLGAITEFKVHAESLPIREGALMKIKKSLLSLYKHLA
jgi:CheY-like chemotaxis protein